MASHPSLRTRASRLTAALAALLAAGCGPAEVWNPEFLLRRDLVRADQAPAGAGAARPGGLVPGGDPVIPGQPGPETAKLFCEDAPPVDPGRLEAEFDYAFFGARRSVNGAGRMSRRGRLSENDFILRAKYGLVTDLDVGGLVAFSRLSDRELGAKQGCGLSDLAVFAKWRFFSCEALDIAISYVPGFGFPVGGQTAPSFLGPPQDFVSFDQKFALTKNLGKWSLSADVGYALPFGGRRADSRGNMIADVALGCQVLPWLQPEVELNWTHNFRAGGGEPDSLAVTAGVLMPFGDRWRVQVGVQQVVAGRNTDLSTAVFAGVLLRF